MRKLFDKFYTWDKIPGFVWLLRILAVILGMIHTWAAAVSHSMNADGISYLDMGDAYLRGDWDVAINSVWSPMYSWILGVVLKIVKPAMEYEFPVVHVVNFVIYLLSMICFEYLWRNLRKYQQTLVETENSIGWNSFPDWIWWGLGYSIFVFSSLHLITIWSVTPDMLMSAFVYLAAGLLVRMRMNAEHWQPFVLLGVVLGLGYLAKAVMFPISIVFLVVALFSTKDFRSRIPRVLISALLFLLISVPFIVIVSIFAGRFTFSDAGTITYARYINGVPYPHWQGEPPGNGTPIHPSRLIFDDPPIYEFGEPVGGTYPISYNPIYWYEGVKVHSDLARQLDYILFSLMYYFELVFRQQAALVVGVILLYWMGGAKPLRLLDFPSRWGLVVIALAAFGFYGMVNVIGRYVGVFIVLFWADLLANIRIPKDIKLRNLATLLRLVMIAFLSMNILVENLSGYWDLSGRANPHQEVFDDGVPPSWPGEVAQELQMLGIEPGDKVAIIGYGFDSFWARLARVKIVAEMFDYQAGDFWLGDDEFQQEVLQAFSETGARAIVGENVPGFARLPGWHQVGNSNHFIFVFSEP